MSRFRCGSCIDEVVVQTLMANALANHLGKKILLINFSSLGASGDIILRNIFRTAQVNGMLTQTIHLYV